MRNGGNRLCGKIFSSGIPLTILAQGAVDRYLAAIETSLVSQREAGRRRGVAEEDALGEDGGGPRRPAVSEPRSSLYWSISDLPRPPNGLVTPKLPLSNT